MTKNNKLLMISLLGFSSGLPFLLVLATLSVWLLESGLTKTQVGLFAWVTVPYSLKFLWAPFVDKIKLPFLFNYLGQRRSWILLSQLVLIIALIGLGTTDPSGQIYYTVIWAFIVGFFAAIQDIAIEAHRIEVLDSEDLGVGASASVMGYRIGMLCSGAGAMYLAAYLQNWHLTYYIMAMFMLIGVITTLFHNNNNNNNNNKNKNKPYNLKEIFFEPLKNFLNNGNWGIILLFIISFKFADTILNVMSIPFLLEIGFSKVEIAQVSKTFGLTAMVIGGLLGGIALTQFSLWSNLVLCVVLQIIASLLFILQAQNGYDIGYLFITTGVENLACGMGQVALITYLSRLCSARYTAMHYALLSSFASFARVNFSAYGGWMADKVNWDNFYAVIAFSCLLTLFLLFFYSKHFFGVTPISSAVILNRGK